MTNTPSHIGPFERHYLRKLNSPLFNADNSTEAFSLESARNRDHELRVAYQHELQAVLQQSVALKPNEESDVILKLKERLDKLYETAASISDNREPQQDAIRQLLTIIMSAVRSGAGNDTQALQELEQEELAREAHFQLLQSALVADLLNPESPVNEKELAPTLLTAGSKDLELALQLFDESQLILILHDTEELMKSVSGAPAENQQAINNLNAIRSWITRLQE